MPDIVSPRILRARARAELNKGPAPIAIRAAPVQQALAAPPPRTFCTDYLVSRLQQFPLTDSKGFNGHPFANALGWQYLMGGREGPVPEALEVAFRTARGEPAQYTIREFLKHRQGTPEEAVTRYWQLYDDYLLPNGNALVAWYEDLLHHVIQINNVYGKDYDDTLLVFNHLEIMRKLADNMDNRYNMDHHEGGKRFNVLMKEYQKVGNTKLDGLRVVCTLWIKKYGFLPTENLDAYNEGNMLWHLRANGVIDFCVRAITQFASHQVKKESSSPGRNSFANRQLSGKYQKEKSGYRFRVFTNWGLIGLPTPDIEQLEDAVHFKQDWWGKPGICAIMANPQAYTPEIFDIARLFIYSGVDPSKGIFPLNDDVQKRVHRDPASSVQKMTDHIHETTWPVTQVVPFRLAEGNSAVGIWPENTRMEASNFAILETYISSIKQKPAPKQRPLKRFREPEEAGPAPKNPQAPVKRSKLAEELEDQKFRRGYAGEYTEGALADLQAKKDLEFRRSYTGEYTEAALKLPTPEPNYLLIAGVVLVLVVGATVASRR